MKLNNDCGECPYWLAFGEPETTEEQNGEIIAHCKKCANGLLDDGGNDGTN